jgi:hypothetical protein
VSLQKEQLQEILKRQSETENSLLNRIQAGSWHDYAVASYTSSDTPLVVSTEDNDEEEYNTVVDFQADLVELGLIDG